jgi:hypothetical protein
VVHSRSPLSHALVAARVVPDLLLVVLLLLLLFVMIPHLARGRRRRR